MNPALWRRVTEVFWEARALNESARACYLDEACAGDGELHAHVQRLLANDAAISQDSVRLNGLTPAGAGQLIAGRYQTRERLGSGGFGDVYRAYDTLLRMPVALKILRDPDPRAVQRFKREFRRLKGFVHPNVVRLYELLHHGEQWILTMELLDGSDFLEACRDNPAALPVLLDQLTAGVESLHEAGILHRDLKPKNIRVTAEDRVVLLDFGLVQELDSDTDSRSRTIALTPAYAAPEQAQPGAPLTGAADWYAVGVMLYEVLTGRQPFEGHWQDVLRRKQEEDPAPPAEGGPLAGLCIRLLDRDASRRAGAGDIRHVLGLAQTAAVPSPRPRFYARQHELARLMGMFHRSQPGAALVRITGGAGIGKTALVREFLRRVIDAHPETVVLAGRCYESEAVPFGSLDDLADAAVRHLKSLSPAAMESLLPRNLACLANLLPVFTELIADRSAPVPEDLFERRRRASLAWREMLGRIAERRRLIIVLDGLQWGDKDSEPFLRDLISDPENPPFLLLMACPDDPAILARLDSLGSPTCVIEIGPLGEEDASALAASLMENESADGPRVRAVVREAAGNPYQIEELARHAVSLTPHECASLQMDSVIGRRLGGLDREPRRMLEAICAARRPVSLDQAARAAGTTDPMAGRNQLLALRLLRSITAGEGERYQPHDERIRDIVTATLAPETVREFHRRFAGASTSVLDRFHHLELSGQLQEASACALEAADDAASQLAFDRAAALYESALRLGNPAAAQRSAILIRMGDALANAGRGAGAAEAFLEAASAVSPLEALRLRARAADQYLRFGYTAAGEQAMEMVLRDAGIWHPKKRWAMLGSLFVHRARIQLLGRRLERISPRPADPLDLAKAECCWATAIGFGLWNPLRGAEFSARHLLMAHRTGDPYRLALAFGAEATHLAHTEPAATGRADRMLELARQSALISRNEHAAAFVTAMRAITTFLAGRWRESKAFAESAIQNLRDNCVNVSRDLQRTQVFMLSSRFLLGDLRDTGRLLDQLVEEARERGDLFATAYLPLAAFGYAIHLARGDRDRALDGVHELRPGVWGPLQVLSFRARTSVALYDGDAQAAWEMVECLWSSIRRSGFLRLQMLGDFLVNARARSAIAMAAAAGTPEPFLRIAGRDARRMRQSALGWSRAHGLLAEAGIASCRGDSAAARELLLEGERGLEASEMGLWLAATRYRIGGEHRETARRWFDEQQVQSPERFADLILPGCW